MLVVTELKHGKMLVPNITNPNITNPDELRLFLSQPRQLVLGHPR